MSWLAFSLLAPLLWAFSNFVDKYLLGSQTKGIFDFLFLTSLLSAVITPFLIPFFGFPELTWYSVLPIVTGMALVCSYGFYGKGIEEGETSQLILLFELIPIFTLILGFLLLGQTISTLEFVAFVLVLLGATGVAVERVDGKFLFAKGAKWMLVAIVMWSFLFLISDFALTKMEFGTFFVLDTLGTALAGIPLLFIPSARSQIIEGFRLGTWSKYGWFSLNGLLDLFGQMSIKKALSLAPAAGLVTVAMQVQSLYGIIIGIGLTLLLPGVIKENISKRNVGKKLLGALIMCTGVGLLFVIDL